MGVEGARVARTPPQCTRPRLTPSARALPEACRLTWVWVSCGPEVSSNEAGHHVSVLEPWELTADDFTRGVVSVIIKVAIKIEVRDCKRAMQGSLLKRNGGMLPAAVDGARQCVYVWVCVLAELALAVPFSGHGATGGAQVEFRHVCAGPGVEWRGCAAFAGGAVIRVSSTLPRSLGVLTRAVMKLRWTCFL